MAYTIYANLESLIKIIDGCANSPEKSSTTKLGKHIPCAYKMSTISAFGHIENNYALYCQQDCIKRFCSSARKHAINTLKFEKEKNVTVNIRRAKITPPSNKLLL